VKTAIGQSEQRTSGYLSLAFFRTTANMYRQNALNPFSLAIPTQQGRAADLRHLVCWGPSDILSISIAKDSALILDAQTAYPSNTSIYEASYVFGALIQPESFELSKLDDLPLAGVCLIKFDGRLHKTVDRSRAFSLAKEGVWNMVMRFKQQNSYGEIYPALAVSYGWEDLVLIVFGKRYDLIKKLVFTLRRDLQFEELKDYLRKDKLRKEFPRAIHAVSATYTTLAVNIELKSANLGGSVEKLRRILDTKDKARVDRVCFQVRPGHVDWPRKNVRLPTHQCQWTCSPGRYDTALQLGRMPFGDYAEFYFTQLWPCIARADSPVLSVQTAFVLNADTENLEDEKSCNQAVKAIPLPPGERRCITDLFKMQRLPKHAATALGSSFLSAWNLRNNHFLKTGMESFVRSVKAVKEPIVKAGSGEGIRYDIATDFILPALEDCFKDRFRGVYPLGEGSGTPLISYKGSFHKQLLLIDRACSHIFESIRQSVSRWTRDSLPMHAFCSCLSPGISPAINPYGWYGYYLAIARIPLDSLFSTRDLYYLYHEVGHVVQEALRLRRDIEPRLFDFMAADAKREPAEEVLKQGRDILEAAVGFLEEVVSDYVMLVVGFRGRTRAFREHARYYADKILNDRAHENTKQSIVLRSIIATELWRGFHGSQDTQERLCRMLVVL
jgi:hypothetical protein